MNESAANTNNTRESNIKTISAFEFGIKTQNFEEAKNALKDFSDNPSTELDLAIVNSKKSGKEWVKEWFLSGDIGRDHKVTGSELNELTNQIQDHFISVNDTQKKIIEEFRQVYNALEKLDEDYIGAILASIKATEATSNRVDVAQKDISTLVHNQLQTLENLEKFKEKLDECAHLNDIDEIWNDCQKWYSEMQKLSDIVSNIESTCTEHAEAITIAKDHIESLLSFKNELMATTHLPDIDSMWNSLMAARSDLDNLQNDLITINKHIDNFTNFVDSIAEYDHLEDIDTMWHKIEDYGNNLDSLNDYKQDILSIIHLKDVDELWDISEKHSNQVDELQKKDEELMNLIQCNKELIDQNLADEKEKNDTALQKLNKKINYAYWVAGGSIALALVELLVIFLR